MKLTPLTKTNFLIPKMDCPAEEQIIRIKLADFACIKSLDFNIPARELSILHEGPNKDLLEVLVTLNFGASISSSCEVEISDSMLSSFSDPDAEARILKLLMVINGGMFFIELVTGIMAESMGLISDSLDMLADTGVYGISLYAVGKTMMEKKKSARVNGFFQMILGLGIIAETIRRFILGSEPEPRYMILISLLALAANVYCMILLSKHKKGEVHMRASYICSSTDVMANVGVVLAGVAVFLTASRYPDLIIGIIVTGIVLQGAYRILKLAK